MERIYSELENTPTQVGKAKDKAPEEPEGSRNAPTQVGKGKGKAPEDPESSRNAGTRPKIEDKDTPAADLLLRPKYWSKRQYVSRKSQGESQGRFMKPFFSRISTDCEISSPLFLA